MARLLRVASTSIRRRLAAAAAAADVTYVKAHINRGSAGNNVLDLEFSDTVTGSDFETGITIGVGINGSTSDYTTIDKSETSSIGIVSDKYIRYTFDGTVSTFQGWNSGTSKGHNLQVSISSSPLNVADLAGADGRVLTNSSTVNLLDGLTERWSLANLLASVNSPTRDLTNENSVTFETNLLAGLGNNANFVGASHQRLIDDSSVMFASGNATIMGWETAGADMVNWMQGTDGGNPSQGIWIPSSNEFKMSFNVFVTNELYSISPDTWYHWGMTFDGTTQKLSVNAVERDTGSPSGGGSYFGDCNTFGANPSSGLEGDGKACETSGHSRVLSGDEIDASYNNGDGNAWPYILDAV